MKSLFINICFEEFCLSQNKNRLTTMIKLVQLLSHFLLLKYKLINKQIQLFFIHFFTFNKKLL